MEPTKTLRQFWGRKGERYQGRMLLLFYKVLVRLELFECAAPDIMNRNLRTDRLLRSSLAQGKSVALLWGWDSGSDGYRFRTRCRKFLEETAGALKKYLAGRSCRWASRLLEVTRNLLRQKDWLPEKAEKVLDEIGDKLLAERAKLPPDFSGPDLRKIFPFTHGLIVYRAEEEPERHRTAYYFYDCNAIVVDNGEDEKRAREFIATFNLLQRGGKLPAFDQLLVPEAIQRSAFLKLYYYPRAQTFVIDGKYLDSFYGLDPYPGLRRGMAALIPF